MSSTNEIKNYQDVPKLKENGFFRLVRKRQTLVERIKTMKEEVDTLSEEIGVYLITSKEHSVRVGEWTVTWVPEGISRTLNKEKLVELGVPVDTLVKAMVERPRDPYLRVTD